VDISDDVVLHIASNSLSSITLLTILDFVAEHN